MKKILVAPLDWGLGHATRCIPIIRLIEREGHLPFIASSGSALELLKNEFPHLTFFEFPAYSPVYPSNGRAMVWKMAMQLPKFSSTIASEREHTERVVASHQIDAVISDNRYGCRADGVPCVFITHQSNILMPRRFGLLASPVRKINENLISKFWTCWIPSLPDQNNLAGDLISFGKFKSSNNVEHVGMLSRFKKAKNAVPVKYKVLAIFSGPEPQRTILEDIIRPQLESSGLSFFVVRGKVSSEAQRSEYSADFLTSKELEEKINESEIIVARSGYSTIMDLAALGKKAIFVPTPGQTEQEYLAARLQSLGLASCNRQNNFNLVQAISESQQFAGFDGHWSNESYLRSAFQKLIALLGRE